MPGRFLRKDILSAKKENLPDFCPDLSPEHPDNLIAAQVRGLHWNPKTQHFEDASGAKIRDRFGQEP